MKKVSILTIFILLTALLLTSVAAVSPRQEQSPNQFNLCGFPLSYRTRQVSHPWVPWEPRPVVGPQKTLVLMVEFSDVKLRSSTDKLANMVEAVKKWFEESSYGKMTIDYYMYPYPVTLPRPYSYYGSPASGAQRGDDPKKIVEYYVSVFTYIYRKTDLDFGEYTHIILIHAGGDEAVTDNANDIWSHCYCLGPAVKKLPPQALEELKGLLYLPDRSGGWHAIYGVETVSEEEDMHVMIHEFTHSNGIPDLYVYAEDGYSKGSEAGFWSNMDAGAFIGADIDGWSKYILGWVEPRIYTIPVNDEVELYTLDNTEGLKAVLVNIPGDPNHYYFIHARRRAGHDVNLPGEGVLVFKVDKTLPKTVEDNFMVKFYDANPNTPEACKQWENDFNMWSMCVKLDAPFNDHKTYKWRKFVLNFENPVFWSEEDKFGIRVLSYDESRGVFKIRLASSPEALGGKGAVTTTTTTTVTETHVSTVTTSIAGTVTTVTGTVTSVRTITTAVAPKPAGGDVWVFIILVIAVLIAAAFVISVRRRAAPPPPPPPSVSYQYCPVCGAPLYPGVRYCWRCGAKVG